MYIIYPGKHLGSTELVKTRFMYLQVTKRKKILAEKFICIDENVTRKLTALPH